MHSFSDLTLSHLSLFSSQDWLPDGVKEAGIDKDMHRWLNLGAGYRDDDNGINYYGDDDDDVAALPLTDDASRGIEPHWRINDVTAYLDLEEMTSFLNNIPPITTACATSLAETYGVVTPLPLARGSVTEPELAMALSGVVRKAEEWANMTSSSSSSSSYAASPKPPSREKRKRSLGIKRQQPSKCAWASC